MDYEFIKVSVENGVGTIEMNRKHEMNALSFGMVTELDHAFHMFGNEEHEARLVLFTGGDECFSAGMDIKEMPEYTQNDASRYFKQTIDLYTQLSEYSKVILSAVSGITFGGGFNLSLMGDIIIASESAIFGHPEIKYGFNPLITPLVSRIGLAKSKELALRGEPIGANEAFEMGLINKVVPPEQFDDEVRSWAETLALRPPDVVQAMKRAFDVVPRLDAKAAIEYELEMTAMLMNTRTEIRDNMRQFMHHHKRHDDDCAG